MQVEHHGADVELSTDDFVVHWSAEDKNWTLMWKWIDDVEPSGIGSGIGEYPRNKLSPEEETQFHAELQTWITNGWLVPHDPDVHGEPGAVLPLIAVSQQHKATTPVRPCLDYLNLNWRLRSNPGVEAPACDHKL